MPARGAQILGEALLPFEHRRGRARAEHREAGGARGVGDPGDERRFGADDDQVDRSRRAPARPPLARSHGSIATQSAQRAMPGLPGAAIRFVAAWRLPKPPRQRIFASARPKQQDIHDCSDLGPEHDDAGLIASARPGDNSPAQTVSELSGALKRTVEGAFGHVRVRGEISGWKRHASGHCYFTLKDEGACIDAVIWKGQAGGLAFRPEDGAEVIATGKLTTYAGRSKYQIVVDADGAGRGGRADGAARPAAAQRSPPKACSTRRKKRAPAVPAARDRRGHLADRGGDPRHPPPPRGPLPDPRHRLAGAGPGRGRGGQGRGGDPRLRRDPRRGGPVPRPDLLIVARGGGSIEDLWAFNEEEVVRAAAASPIPLISRGRA